MKKAWLKIVSLVLVISTLFSTLPMTAFAEGAEAEEVYIKSVQLARAETKEEAKSLLENEGYIFLDANLNAGTGEDGIWMGYTTTTDPEEAIYDMKLMNMKGGFTLTSMEEALAAQEGIFAQMATDLNYLVEEFIEAYDEESIPAQKAYQSLNFFRVVKGETELEERNGLGYQIVNGNMSIEKLNEMLLLCDPGLVDSVIKILTTGIQIRNGNWMKKLSALGPYDADEVYYEDEFEEEFKRRAEQLLPVLQLYSQAYNAMDLSGLIPDKLDENFEAEYSGDEQKGTLSAEDATVKKLDESRYKLYKVVFDELDKYQYGTNETLKDFFCSLENDGSTKDLYPLVSVLSDGEFASLSYGCFLEIATGAGATLADFDSFDQVYASVTKEVKSVYLYHGVDDILFEDDTVIGFTEAATRHMASTGELEFYEKETAAEEAWEVGKTVAQIVGYSGMAILGVAKIAAGVSMGVAAIASAVGSSVAESALLAGVIKVGTLLGSLTSLLIVGGAALAVALVSFIVSAIIDEVNGWIDWDKNPMPEYLYDVKEVGFSQTSVNDGIATEFIKKPVFALYEAVTDKDGKVIDLNARSGDAYQWIAMYVSYDRQGDDAKPIKADSLMVKTGNGETPDGYVPLSRFGEVVAYDLNQWDETDDVNGIYAFYKQDQTVSVDDGKTYYIYDVYLQTGESDAHCIELLKAAGYTPLNVNLSPDLYDDDTVLPEKIYTYLGYKTTKSKSSAIRDIRLVYGPSQGQIQLGAATYADSGSNGQVTLYATKFKSAGTPLLAGGLICVNRLNAAAAGYEPICKMAGGPAASFNVSRAGTSSSNELQTYLYFLPETTFTSGKKYIGDIAFFHISEDETATGRPGLASLSALDLEGGNTELAGLSGSGRGLSSLSMTTNDYWSTYKPFGDENSPDRMGYYPTYNPYRAVYDVKAALREDLPTTFAFEGAGYVAFDKAEFEYINNTMELKVELAVRYGNASKLFDDNQLNGAFYLTGNPAGENVHKTAEDAESGEPTNEMTGIQPLAVSDIICSAPYQKKGSSYQEPTIPSNYSSVTDVFSTSKEAAEILHKDGERKFKLYIAKTETQKPYISNIFAIDTLSIFRASGAYETGLDIVGIPNDIGETMLLSQLASQGATNFCGESIPISTESCEINMLEFGYQRTEDPEKALRDVFLYFNKFSTDAPPKVLYRGTVTYTMICEIPYNLTGYNDAPKPGIYLYGSTNEKAGNPITDFDISLSPFFDGYETVRTKDGRSLWSEILDYLNAQKSAHPMNSAKDVYGALIDFFSFPQGIAGEPQQNGNFFLHIKREGVDLRKEKPYVGKIYLASAGYDEYYGGYKWNWTKLYNELFDKGAEACVNFDLNENTSGPAICLGYSFTSDPNDAIRDISAYHKKNPPATLTDDGGRKYTLVQDLDLNKDASGDYIYLYATKDLSAGRPIISLSAGYDVVTGSGKQTWVDGTEVSTNTYCTKRWDTNSYSDLNRWAGGKYIYLMFTDVNSTFKGTYTPINYGADKTFSRSGYTGIKPDGKYIGGLYVMDKNTILQEKIAAGTLPKGSTCDKITDNEVKERLKAMGAEVVIDTPIQTTGATYFKNNKNKVYIGYSRTNTLRKAIRGIAIKTEILSLNEPAESITVDDNNYNLVAESASNVASLPRAINLIGVDNGQDLLVPRMYLYYSTSVDNDPIYDIIIDSDPIKSGYLTAFSSNEIDPFADISAQAQKQKEFSHKDYIENNTGSNDSYKNTAYSRELSALTSDISNSFNPAEEDLTPFYIHTKHYTAESLEALKPYISEVFVSEGATRYAALADMVKYGVDGFVDRDLNQSAGGNFVYLGYKRTEKAEDALTDLVVFEGKNPEESKRLDIDGKTVKYTLVSNVDLNSNAGGKWLYLYFSDSANTGNPLKGLRVEEEIVSYLKCGVEEVTVKRAEDKVITNENIDLNKSAGGDYLYLIMNRETTAGHDYSILKKTTDVPATCGEDGALTGYYECSLCGADGEVVEKVYPATGKHKDADGDGDHKCDVCGAKNITAHVEGEVQREDEVASTCTEKGSYHLVVYCVECEDELRNTVLYLPLDPDNHKDGKDADHNCDYCGLKIEDHTPGKPVEEDRIEPTEDTDGSYKKVVYCKECKEKLSEETIVLPALNKAEPDDKDESDDKVEPDDSELVASLFGDGSIVIICSIAGIAILAAIIIYIQKKKKGNKGENDNE